MPSASRDIAMQGKLNMDQFQNRLNAVKDNQLRSVMFSSNTQAGIAPKQVISAKLENPDTMAEMVQEKKWVIDTAQAKRQEVANRKLLQYGVVGLVLFIVFK